MNGGEDVTSRGFWDGMIAGGILGAAVTLMWAASPNSRERTVRQVAGKMNRARQFVEDMGSGAADAWRR